MLLKVAATISAAAARIEFGPACGRCDKAVCRILTHMDELLTAEQVAQRWHMETATVLRLADTGAIPAVKEGAEWRFPSADFPAPAVPEPADEQDTSLDDALAQALRLHPSAGKTRVLLMSGDMSAGWKIAENALTLHPFETLSLDEGVHQLSNGRGVITTRAFLREYTHRLCLDGEKLAELNPPDILAVGNDIDRCRVFRVRVTVKDDTGFHGPLRFSLSTESPLHLRTRQHVQVVAGPVIETSVRLDPAYAPILFDGAVLAPPDTHIFVSAAKQPALQTQSEDVLLFREDVDITINLRRDSALLTGTSLKFQYQKFPTNEDHHQPS